MNETENGASRRRYDKKTRKLLQRRIKALSKEQPELNYIEMAELLNGEGFRAPDGTPLTNFGVSLQARNAGLVRKVVKRRGARSADVHEVVTVELPEVPTSDATETISLVEIISASNISPERKVQVLKHLLKE